MSGYFGTNTAAQHHHPSLRGGNDGIGMIGYSHSDAQPNNGNNNATTAALVQQLASAMQQQSNNQQSSLPIQQDEMTRMAMMLAQQLALAGNNVNVQPATNDNDNITSTNGNRHNQSRTNIRSASASSQHQQHRSFFQKESNNNPSSRMYGPKSSSRNIHTQNQMNQSSIQQQQQQQHHHHPSSPPKITNITPKQQQYYTLERSLLRELIVLTMRHSNGTLLKFVPSQEEQLHLFRLWNTNGNNGNGNNNTGNGYPIGNRFSKRVISEGVRVSPTVKVLPKWNNRNNNDGDNGDNTESESGETKQHTEGTYQDLQFRATLPPTLPHLLGSGAHDAISLCGECGWLYGRIATYIERILEEDVDGVHCATSRALASRLDRELGVYHEQLSLLEGELPPLVLLSSEYDDTVSGVLPQAASSTRRYLTLRSLSARIIPIRDHLHSLAILADGVGAVNLRGGKLLATIVQHSLDGYTRHSELVRSIAADCSVPWYKLLNGWMTQGVLDDVHSEFFVREVKPHELSRGRSSRDGMVASSGFFTWHQRYVLVEGLIPLCSCGGVMDIITVDLAREVLLVGKGINFIRYCLQDKEWEVLVEEEKNGGSSAQQQGQKYNFATLMDVTANDDELKCVSTLHEAVLKSSARIHSHILDSLQTQHHMMEHLLALKNFLFLGQGDFVSSFVESLDQEFRGRTSLAGIYSHTLSSVLEGSLRTTTARFLPDLVLGNLRARLVVNKKDPDQQYSMGQPPKKGQREEMVPWKDNEDSIQDPWNSVYLDYKINSPLDAIVHTSAKDIYHRVFLFLFRLKRVEWMLNNSWRQSTALNHAILIETKAGGADAPAISEAAEHSSFLLRRISSLRQTMLHFISNLQNYLMFEVLEGGWEALTQSLKKAKSLDDVIRAHDSYLNDIVDKTLLSNDGGENGEMLENLLQFLLSIALKFGKFQDHIFSNSLAGLDKAAKIRRRVEERADKGDWGRKTLDKEEGRVFLYLADAKLFEFVQHTASEFDRSLSDLLKRMSKQIDEVDYNAALDDDQDEVDPVMKTHDALPFLLFRLDFSGYYARQARENRKKKQSS